MLARSPKGAEHHWKDNQYGEARLSPLLSPRPEVWVLNSLCGVRAALQRGERWYDWAADLPASVPHEMKTVGSETVGHMGAREQMHISQPASVHRKNKHSGLTEQRDCWSLNSVLIWLTQFNSSFFGFNDNKGQTAVAPWKKEFLNYAQVCSALAVGRLVLGVPDSDVFWNPTVSLRYGVKAHLTP